MLFEATILITYRNKVWKYSNAVHISMDPKVDETVDHFTSTSLCQKDKMCLTLEITLVSHVRICFFPKVFLDQSVTLYSF